MTLVVSEVSEHGILMLGDSAISEKVGDAAPVVKSVGVAKVIYLENANIAVSMWGFACMDNDGQQVSAQPLVRSFLQEISRDGIEVEELGKALASFATSHLEPLLAVYGCWFELRCGFHIGGFIDGMPVLYHVHCQLEEEGEEAHKPMLYKDFPDNLRVRSGTQITFNNNIETIHNESSVFDIGDTSSAGSYGMPGSMGSYCGSNPPLPIIPDIPEPSAYDVLKQNGFFHLRNGIIDDFIDGFDNIYGRTSEEVMVMGRQCLETTLIGRYEFYQSLIEGICDMYSNLKYGKPHFVGRPILGCWFNHCGERELFFDGSVEVPEKGCFDATIKF